MTDSDWILERDTDDIAWLHLDRRDETANTLSGAVLEALETVLLDLAEQPPAGLVILSDKPNGFIAGADVREFTALSDRAQAIRMIRRGQGVFTRLAGLPCPTVALIHGYCVGGGLELALACRYRVAEDGPSTRLGLPEVKLGIHPGFGGTVRLPALVGALGAMDLMLTGRTVSARQARRLGLVDHAVPQRQLRLAARALIADPPMPRRPPWQRAFTNHRSMRPLIAPLLRRRVAARAPQEHYPAPYALIDLWQRHWDDPARMLEREAESVADLIRSPTARQLVRAFLLQERLKRLGRTTGTGIRHVHVVGAGIMGGDIAAWCALQGLSVTLQDQSPERIAPAVGRAHALFMKRLRDRHRVTAAMDRLLPDHRGRGIPRAQLVIEAVFEDKETKLALFRQLEPAMADDALLATNTSSLPLEELAPALTRPARLVGLHFFNPVAKMQLVEVVGGRVTNADALTRALGFVRQIDRLPLPVASTPGFLVNRVLMPYLLEAVELASEGVPIAAIDAAARSFGMPMGPIELADTVGLDVCLHVADILATPLPVQVPARLRDLVRRGQLGRKSGEGFYTYVHGRRAGGRPPRGYSPPGDLADRLILRMLNEAVASLRSGTVEDADLLDAGMIYGIGFAPFRGGPMQYIRDIGSDRLHSRLQDLERRYGARFAPDPGWTAAPETITQAAHSA